MNVRTRSPRPERSLALSFLLLAWAVAPAQAQAAPGNCAGAGPHRALDFTIGTWTVTAPEGTSEGPSVIRSAVNGCMLVEDWGGPGDGGRNVDAYSADDRQWHRLYVDSAGRVHLFAGRSDGGTIGYEGTSHEPDGGTALNRLTLRPRGADAFDELWQKSRDGGKTWKTVFAGTYRRAKS
jgi:hypothetical protein